MWGAGHHLCSVFRMSRRNSRLSAKAAAREKLTWNVLHNKQIPDKSLTGYSCTSRDAALLPTHRLTVPQNPDDGCHG